MVQSRNNFERETSFHDVMVSTADEIPGFEIIDYLGVVFGITVRTRGVGGQCMGGCQSCFGGEITAYTQSSIEARNDALRRLCDETAIRGGNAVIGVDLDYETISIGQAGGMLMVSANGTAVVIENK